MYKMLAVLLFVTASLGCTRTQLCDGVKTVAKPVADSIVTILNCENREAVTKSVENFFGAKHVCDEVNAKGFIGDFVCEPVVGEIIAFAKTVPSDWKCFGGKDPNDPSFRQRLLDRCKDFIALKHQP